MKSNEKIIKAVEQYAEAIVSAIKEQKYDFDYDLDYAEAYNESNTEEARSALITTAIGVVVVIPDFKKKGARACVLKLGEMRRLELEGFDEEFIEREGKIYGDLLPFSSSNAEVLAYYLTHKLNYNGKVLN